MHLVKIVEHIRSRKGNRLIVEIPEELSRQIANEENELLITVERVHEPKDKPESK